LFKVTENLHLFSENLYRMGSSTSSRISNVRPTDIKTIEVNGISYVMSNTGGISLMDSLGLKKTPMKGWVWEIAKGTNLPTGLKLVHDKVGHFSLEPTTKMTKSKFIFLLEELVAHSKRYIKK